MKIPGVDSLSLILEFSRAAVLVSLGFRCVRLEEFLFGFPAFLIHLSGWVVVSQASAFIGGYLRFPLFQGSELFQRFVPRPGRKQRSEVRDQRSVFQWLEKTAVSSSDAWEKQGGAFPCSGKS
jgi:hypothetical protein